MTFGQAYSIMLLVIIFGGVISMLIGMVINKEKVVMYSLVVVIIGIIIGLFLSLVSVILL